MWELSGTLSAIDRGCDLGVETLDRQRKSRQGRRILTRPGRNRKAHAFVVSRDVVFWGFVRFHRGSSSTFPTMSSGNLRGIFLFGLVLLGESPFSSVCKRQKKMIREPAVNQIWLKSQVSWSSGSLVCRFGFLFEAIFWMLDPKNSD